LYGRVVGSWKSFTTQDGMPSNELYSIAAQGNTLYLAQPKGITQVSEKGITTTKLPGTIFQVEATGKDIWAAGCQEIFRREGDNWLNYANVPNGIALAMTTDSKGRLFAGNRSGLYLFQEERWVYIAGAGGVGVSALQIIPDDTGKELLWIGAESGAVLVISVPE
jgi:ligand-binding sensor domain-containing protein